MQFVYQRWYILFVTSLSLCYDDQTNYIQYWPFSDLWNSFPFIHLYNSFSSVLTFALCSSSVLLGQVILPYIKNAPQTTGVYL